MKNNARAVTTWSCCCCLLSLLTAALVVGPSNAFCPRKIPQQSATSLLHSSSTSRMYHHPLSTTMTTTAAPMSSLLSLTKRRRRTATNMGTTGRPQFSRLRGSTMDEEGNISVNDEDPNNRSNSHNSRGLRLLQMPAALWKHVSALQSPTSLVSTAAVAATVASLMYIVLVPTSVQAATSAWYASLAETGFYQAFSLVFVSELGDKTFFIAGLLAMKTTRWISAIGSIGALTVMTLISVAIGQVFHVVPTGFLGDGSLPIDDILAAAAFLFFGLKTLKEALDMEEDGNGMAGGGSGGGGMEGELKEAQEAVDENQSNVLNKNTLGQIASIFALVFAAEFGDRSFLSTIALSAAQKPWAVAGGAICAHALATGVAVTGGSVVAKYLSEKVIGVIGGTLFIVFAVTTVLGIF